MGLFLSGGKGLSTRGAALLLDTESTSNAWNVSPLKRGLRDRDRLGWGSCPLPHNRRRAAFAVCASGGDRPCAPSGA